MGEKGGFGERKVGFRAGRIVALGRRAHRRLYKRCHGEYHLN